MANKKVSKYVYILAAAVIVAAVTFIGVRVSGFVSLDLETTSQISKQGPQITILSPNGGETLNGHVDTYVAVSNEWLNVTLTSVDLYLVDETLGGETKLIGGIQSLERRDGAFTEKIVWNTDRFEEGVYYLKVTLRDHKNNLYKDKSDSYIVIDNTPRYAARGTEVQV